MRKGARRCGEPGCDEPVVTEVNPKHSPNRKSGRRRHPGKGHDLCHRHWISERSASYEPPPKG